MTESASIYQDPRHYDLLAQMTAPNDLPFYAQWASQQQGPILELGCGTGRIAIPLASAGHQVHGLDSAEPMLAFAAQKASDAGVQLQLTQADFCDFDLAKRFGLVIVAYNALNSLLDLPAIGSCLRCIKQHMRDDGVLLIDTFNPSLAFLGADPERRLRLLEYIDPDSNQRVVLEEQNIYDAVSQINHILWRYEIGDLPDERVDELFMRIFFPQELDALLQLHGFTIDSKLGNYDGSSFEAQSSKQLMVCSKTEPL